MTNSKLQINQKLPIVFGIWCLVLGICFAPFAQAAVMSSGTYRIQIDSLNVGGGYASSPSYVFESTAGEAGTAKLAGTSNNLYAGFQLPFVATPSPTPSPSAGGGLSQAGTGRAGLAELLNVEQFVAIPGNGQTQLQWQNPASQDFAGVWIMRSEIFYPSSPFDGLLIYKGSGESFLNTGLQNGKQYYYTAFTYDADGNFASGAIASVIPFDSASLDPARDKPPTPSPEPPMVPKDQIPPELRRLSLLDFDFIQEGFKILPVNDRIEIKSDSPLTIAIDYDKLPEILKTILVIMESPPAGGEGKVFSFLLRVDEEKKRYLASMHPPAASMYPVTFVVVDYQNQGLQKVGGELVVKQAGGGSPSGGGPPSDGRGAKFFFDLLMFLLIVLLLLAALKYIYRKVSGRDSMRVQIAKSK